MGETSRASPAVGLHGVGSGAMREGVDGITGTGASGASRAVGSSRAPTPDERREILLRYANDSVLLFDAAFRIVDCNDRALDVFGYSRDELIGSGIDAVRAEQADAPLSRRQSEVVESGSAVFESVGRRKDGSTFPIETSLRVVDGEHGRLYHATVRDITERRVAEVELRRSRALLHEAEEAASIGHWTWDRETDALEPSKALLRLVGADPDARTPAADLRARPPRRSGPAGSCVRADPAGRGGRILLSRLGAGR